jgi:putative intracellular protease/amidase
MQFLNDPEAQELVKSTKMLSGIAASDFDAIFYVGGHGPGTLSLLLALNHQSST